jgi:hypothetical protein
VYTFPTASLAPPGSKSNITALKQRVCQSITTTNGIEYCSTTFQHGGQFNHCNAKGSGVANQDGPYYTNGLRKQNLIFEAICITTGPIQLGKAQYKNSKTTDYIVSVTSNLDAISMLFFVLGISWIRYQILKETKMGNKNQCTADDYTVICYTLPKCDNSLETIATLDEICFLAENGSRNPSWYAYGCVAYRYIYTFIYVHIYLNLHT